jgi:hypothetical protein
VPATVGPVAADSTEVATQSIGPAECASGHGIGDPCAYCGGTARVALGVRVRGAEIESQATYWYLGEQPKGTGYPIQCP